MTFRLLAAVFLGTTAVGAVLLRNPPDDYRRGEIAGGGRQRDVDAPPSAALVARPDFRLLWAAFAFGSLSGQMVISQLVPFARSVGLGTLASLAIPIAAAGNVSGRVISGWISDRAGRLTTMQIMVVGSAFAMTGLFVWREQPLLFFVFVAAVYWCYGTQMSVFASTTADFFGTSHLGMNWGLMLSTWAWPALSDRSRRRGPSTVSTAISTRSSPPRRWRLSHPQSSPGSARFAGSRRSRSIRSRRRLLGEGERSIVALTQQALPGVATQGSTRIEQQRGIGRQAGPRRRAASVASRVHRPRRGVPPGP